MTKNAWPELVEHVKNGANEDEAEILMALCESLSDGHGLSTSRVGNQTRLGITKACPDGQGAIRRSGKGKLVLELSPATRPLRVLGEEISAALESEPKWLSFALAARSSGHGDYQGSHVQIRHLEIATSPSEWPPPSLSGPVRRNPPLESPLLLDLLVSSPRSGFVGAHRSALAYSFAVGIAALAVRPTPRSIIPPGRESAFVSKWDAEQQVVSTVRLTHGFQHADHVGGWLAHPPTVAASRCLEIPVQTFLSELPLDNDLAVADVLNDLPQRMALFSPERKARTRRSLAWYADAWHAPNSQVALLCAAIAIEALIESKAGDKCTHCKETLGPPKCPECGLLQRQSTKTFNSFLHQYAGGTFDTSRLKLVNAARNLGAHGAVHYLTDEAFAAIESRGADTDPMIAVYAARAAILNWLMDDEPSVTSMPEQ